MLLVPNWGGELERMSGEIHERERLMRTLERLDSPILTGYQPFHNYIRRKWVKGKTPAEAAAIRVDGKDKWLTIIPNVRRNMP
jgi:hypothetical protein